MSNIKFGSEVLNFAREDNEGYREARREPEDLDLELGLGKKNKERIKYQGLDRELAGDPPSPTTFAKASAVKRLRWTRRAGKRRSSKI